MLSELPRFGKHERFTRLKLRKVLSEVISFSRKHGRKLFYCNWGQKQFSTFGAVQHLRLVLLLLSKKGGGKKNLWFLFCVHLTFDENTQFASKMSLIFDSKSKVYGEIKAGIIWHRGTVSP